MGNFLDELTAVINRYSMENGSDTPDFLLAAYLAECLTAYDKAVSAREKWYGRDVPPAAITGDVPVDPPHDLPTPSLQPGHGG